MFFFSADDKQFGSPQELENAIIFILSVFWLNKAIRSVHKLDTAKSR